MRTCNYLFKIAFCALLFYCTNLSAADPTSVTDKDGNVYSVVKIGNLFWTTENLRVTTFNNGDKIIKGDTLSTPISSGDYTIAAYFIPDPNTKKPSTIYTVQKTGYLYTWKAANDARGIAPDGWRVPSNEDWIDFEKGIGMSDEDIAKTGTYNRGIGLVEKIKSTEVNAWTGSGTLPTSNLTGFSAYPIGYWEPWNRGDRSNLAQAEWWVAGELSPTNKGMRRKIHNTVDGIYRDINDRNPAEAVNIRLVSGTLPASGLNNINNLSDIMIHKTSDNHIIVSGSSIFSDVNINIYDSSGKTICHQKTKAGEFSVKLNISKNGIYLIKVTDHEGSKLKKIII